MNEPRTERKSEVAVEIDNVNRRINKLEDIIDQLENRLAVVLRSQEPADEADCIKTSTVLTPLASHIREGSTAMEDQLSRIESILNRLEL